MTLRCVHHFLYTIMMELKLCQNVIYNINYHTNGKLIYMLVN